MKFSEFKARLTQMLVGDTVAFGDADIRWYIQKCGNEILTNHTILSHLEIDPASFTPLYFIDDELFVRAFSEPNSSDDIDFSEPVLVSALLNLVAYQNSITLKSEFKAAFNRDIMQYELSINHPALDTIRKLMWARGWGKPYRISYGLRGTEYEWDDGFLGSLDGYLADKKARRGLTYEHFIDDFIKFQNGDEKAQARADLRDLDKKRMPYKNNLKNNVEAFKNNGGN